jgi:pimeloyl-ACP methyl ester carboxylesterase
MEKTMTVQPFTIHVAQHVLDDLQSRLAMTRWPDALPGIGWGYGTDLAYLQELVQYWQHAYDWRGQEAKLNSFPHFRAPVNDTINGAVDDIVDGTGIHFIHVRGTGRKPMPLLLIHGWPDSFVRMLKLIPLLTDPARFGGNPDDTFDVIVPSIPGFGFSDRPAAPGMNSVRIAELFTRLMRATLGYARFGVAGGDIGSRIARLMAIANPEHVRGLHLTDIGFEHEVAFPPALPDPTPAEAAYQGATGYWFMTEGAYIMMQSTKPQTLAYGLHDSPVALAAWIVEKFRAWSDCDGDVERCFSKDELLTHIMIYWVTQTANSSIRLYAEDGQLAPALQPGQFIETPAGVALFPKEMGQPPRAVGERFLRLQRWTEMPRGGHFAALEEPELLTEELRAFYRPLREEMPATIKG